MAPNPDETPAPAAPAAPAAPGPPRGQEREEPTLPDVSRDELDVGWGDEPAERDDEWYHRERPPHHEG